MNLGDLVKVTVDNTELNGDSIDYLGKIIGKNTTKNTFGVSIEGLGKVLWLESGDNEVDKSTVTLGTL